ncbi:hypothetical protein K438DRAFT_1973184 [Mycena galopus ATCC 62051]|nr:hypothetical protein K438DRAFT_1973184 [Mycena galopus ATCC 62051]
MHDINITLLILRRMASSIISSWITLGIIMPFVGVLVRYRANYTPKAGAVRLDDEPGLPVNLTSDASLSYFGMMKRVYRIEGWGGLYKGLMPSSIATVVFVVLSIPIDVVVAFGLEVMPHGSDPLVWLWTMNLAHSVVLALLLVPAQIFINRIMDAQNNYNTLQARRLRHADSSPHPPLPAERAQPLRLYLAPGVAFAFFIEKLVASALVVIPYAAGRPPAGAFFGGALSVIPLATAILTPLDVMAARLTLQRRGPEALAIPAEPPTPDAPSMYAEPVMHFRTDEVPYTGLLDGGRKMVAEEGWGVLARAWWLTVLRMVLPLGILVLLQWGKGW